MQGNWNNDITHSNTVIMVIIKALLEAHTCVTYQVKSSCFWSDHTQNFFEHERKKLETT